MPSLFGGLSGVAFSVRYLSLDGHRYKDAQRILDGHLATRLNSVVASLTRSSGVYVAQYDQITGVSGIGRYLLTGVRQSLATQRHE